MNAAPTEPGALVETKLPSKGSWSRGRWWLLIALVFALHLGLIFAFGDRRPVTLRPPAFAPPLRLAVDADADELLALNDPTLFALPHRQGFAGAMWLQMPAVKFQPFRWTEPPRVLALPVEALGATFAQFMQTNALAPFELEAKPALELTLPVAPEIATAAPSRSTLRLAGDLANRRLLNPPELLSWPAADLLTNSVVQVLVSADGSVISAILLPPGSGSKDVVDQRALELARAARFEPLRNGAAKLTLGALIFEWQTVPLSETNQPPANP